MLILLSLQFSNIKHFRRAFLRNSEAYVDNGQMYRVYLNQAAAAGASYSSLYFFFFFLSNFQTLKFSSVFFSRTVRPT